MPTRGDGATRIVRPQYMAELGNTSAWSTATDTPAHAGMTTDALKGTTDAGWQSIRLFLWLVVINLRLVAIQALSAGFLLSGYERAVTVHGDVVLALQLGAFIQGHHRRCPVAETPRTGLGGRPQYRAVRDCFSSGQARLPQVVLAACANWRRHLRLADARSVQAKGAAVIQHGGSQEETCLASPRPPTSRVFPSAFLLAALTDRTPAY